MSINVSDPCTTRQYVDRPHDRGCDCARSTCTWRRPWIAYSLGCYKVKRWLVCCLSI